MVHSGLVPHRTAVPYLCRSLAVVAQPEDVLARREVLWDVQLVVHRNVRHLSGDVRQRSETHVDVCSRGHLQHARGPMSGSVQQWAD